MKDNMIKHTPHNIAKVDSGALVDALHLYKPADMMEQQSLEQTLAFLRECKKVGLNPFCRTTLRGHVTASAVVFDSDKTHCLMLHHKKLDKWLFPGGHCDGEPDVHAAALREVLEETGVTVAVSKNVPFDVDAHFIPERGDEPRHIHYDICFLAQAPRDAVVISDESNDVRWIALDNVINFTQSQRIKRLLKKINGEIGNERGTENQG